MDTSFDRSAKATDEWYTPKELIDSLGEFDLDPCAPMKPLWPTAKVMYNKEDDGLSKNWGGVNCRVWLNPPYSKPLIEQFLRKMVEHGNGIVLLFNRLDSVMMQEVVLKNAHAMKFLRKRIRFYREDGTQGGSPGSGSVLFAFGKENAEVLKNNSLEGVFVRLKD